MTIRSKPRLGSKKSINYVYRSLAVLSLFSTVSPYAVAQGAQPIPDDFPRFTVPGHQAAMDSVRAL